MCAQRIHSVSHSLTHSLALPSFRRSIDSRKRGERRASLSLAFSVSVALNTTTTHFWEKERKKGAWQKHLFLVLSGLSFWFVVFRVTLFVVDLKSRLAYCRKSSFVHPRTQKSRAEEEEEEGEEGEEGARKR